MLQLGYRFTQDQDKLIEWINNGFLKVYQNIHRLNNKDNHTLGGWIRTIVYRSIIDGVRSEKKYWSKMVFDQVSNGPVITYKIGNQLEFEDLQTLIQSLDEKTKTVFKLYVIEGYNHAEIAKQLHISAGTSKWYLSKARKELQAIINNSNEIY
ncbi:MAG: sigma-70 family RNA polymerase sigma factor [Saprospiraceae bacterium]|nr:sigma-70 family RNA polymerase sigma factor [Saprospiraceae bacterium]